MNESKTTVYAKGITKDECHNEGRTERGRSTSRGPQGIGQDVVLMVDEIPAVPNRFMTYIEDMEGHNPDAVEEPEPVDIHTQNTDKVVLPSEGRMIEHFCKLYIEFNDALSEQIPNEPFTTDQRIALYTLYSSQWGHHR